VRWLTNCSISKDVCYRMVHCGSGLLIEGKSCFTTQVMFLFWNMEESGCEFDAHRA
jgi:hypothetical protein